MDLAITSLPIPTYQGMGEVLTGETVQRLVIWLDQQLATTHHLHQHLLASNTEEG